jgi:hypothetical protein
MLVNAVFNFYVIFKYPEIEEQQHRKVTRNTYAHQFACECSFKNVKHSLNCMHADSALCMYSQIQCEPLSLKTVSLILASALMLA